MVKLPNCTCASENTFAESPRGSSPRCRELARIKFHHCRSFPQDFLPRSGPWNGLFEQYVPLLSSDYTCRVKKRSQILGALCAQLASVTPVPPLTAPPCSWRGSFALNSLSSALAALPRSVLCPPRSPSPLRPLPTPSTFLRASSLALFFLYSWGHRMAASKPPSGLCVYSN